MDNYSNSEGFTLIELMIVIAIIGILAAVALPAYQDYTVRVKLADPIVKARSAASQASEYYTAHSSWPQSNTVAGLVTATSYTSPYVQSLSISGTRITVVLNQIKAGAINNNQTIALVGTDTGGSIKWQCSTAIAPKYVPAECR